jgi:hypothetical protein
MTNAPLSVPLAAMGAPFGSTVSLTGTPFFGGLLLSLGLGAAAIGLVGYRARRRRRVFAASWPRVRYGVRWVPSEAGR